MFDLLYDINQFGTNKIIKGETFHISYAPNTSAGPETALVKEIKGRDTFLILLGDYRKEYKEVIPKGYAACKRLYKKLIKDGAEVSPWSD